MSKTTRWVATAVQRAIADARRTKTSLAEEIGIPYSTLNRKVAGHSEFTLPELLAIAEALHVHPGTFVPPAFRTGHAA